MNVLTQPMQALQLANEIRVANAKTKDEIKQLPVADAAARVAAILSQPSGPAGAIHVDALLRCVRCVGAHKAARLLLAAGIYRHDRPVRELTPRQRTKLAGLLPRGGAA